MLSWEEVLVDQAEVGEVEVDHEADQVEVDHEADRVEVDQVDETHVDQTI